MRTGLQCLNFLTVIMEHLRPALLHFLSKHTELVSILLCFLIILHLEIYLDIQHMTLSELVHKPVSQKS